MRLSEKPHRTLHEEKTAASIAVLQQAALEIIAKSGCSAVTMVNLGERAGVSRGLPQYHFNSKQELMQSLFTRAEAIEESLLSDPPWGDKRGVEAICGAIDWNIGLIKRNPLTVRGHICLVTEASNSSALDLRKEVERYNTRALHFYSRLIFEALPSNCRRAEAERIAWVVIAAFRGIINTWALDPNNYDVIGALDELKRMIRSRLSA